MHTTHHAHHPNHVPTNRLIEKRALTACIAIHLSPNASDKSSFAFSWMFINNRIYTSTHCYRAHRRNDGWWWRQKIPIGICIRGNEFPNSIYSRTHLQRCDATARRCDDKLMQSNCAHTYKQIYIYSRALGRNWSFFIGRQIAVCEKSDGG